jgi:hypothetical protein
VDAAATDVTRLVAILALVALAAGVARAQNELTLRGNYWRDRNTRVIQPEADINQEFSTGTTVGTHYLLDAITSASVAAGVQSDQAFTELRNEFGVRLGQQLGRNARILGSYSYSSESDYWAHLVTLSGSVDLAQRNTTLGATLAYGHDNVGQRMGPTAFSILGSLDSVVAIFGLTQLLSPYSVLNLGFDVGANGFGDKNNGFQANPYRTVLLGGSPSRESVPFQRVRWAVALALHLSLPTGLRLMPAIMFRPSYRYYQDDWGISSHTPELRTYVPIGPVELRFTGRYYTQTHASFWREQFGLPAYVNTPGDPMGSSGAYCTDCSNSSAKNVRFFSADPKLSAFSDYYFEVRVQLKLFFLRPLSRWLSNGLFDLSYGHVFESGYPRTAFGDADTAGVQFIFPL